MELEPIGGPVHTDDGESLGRCTGDHEPYVSVCAGSLCDPPCRDVGGRPDLEGSDLIGVTPYQSGHHLNTLLALEATFLLVFEELLERSEASRHHFLYPVEVSDIPRRPPGEIVPFRGPIAVLPLIPALSEEIVDGLHREKGVEALKGWIPPVGEFGCLYVRVDEKLGKKRGGFLLLCD